MKITHSNHNKQKDTRSQINEKPICYYMILQHQQHDLPQYTLKYCALATLATNIACNELWTRAPKHMPTPSAAVPHKRGCYCIVILNSYFKFICCFH